MSDEEASTDANADLNERLDRLSAQVDLIAEELRLQRQSREMWSDLNETLVPVTRGAMDMATVEFEELSEEVSLEDATRLARTLARSLPQLEALLAQVGPLSELVHDLNSLTGAATEQLTEILSVAEAKGYFAFARQGGAIANQAVTVFTDDDLFAPPPSLFGIAKSVNDPQTRRGLARLMAVVRAAGEQTTHPTENAT